MVTALEFLKKAGVFYVTTTDGKQPKCRPFGIVAQHNDRLYICTKDDKECYKQMIQNPLIEICAMAEDDWIRITGEIAPDPSKEAKAALLEQNPFAQKIYSIDDPHFAVLCFKKATANIYQSIGQIVSVPLI